MNDTFVAVDLKPASSCGSFRPKFRARNRGFFLNSDKTLNSMMLFRGVFEQNAFQVERLFAIGSIASSPLVMNEAVYFGSADGYVYALQ